MPLLKDRIRDRLNLMLTGQVAAAVTIPVINLSATARPRKISAAGGGFAPTTACGFHMAVPDYVAETGET